MASGTSNFQRGGLPYRGAPSQQVGRGGARSGGGALGHSQAPQQQIQQQQLPAQQPQQQRGASGAAQMGQGQAAEITDEQREEIDGAFQLFDIDKDGHLDYHEFKVAVKSLGFEMSKADLNAILQKHGVPSPIGPVFKSRPGAGSYVRPTKLILPAAVFHSLMTVKIANRNPREEIDRAFDLFDANGKGLIDAEDLRRIAEELGEALSEEELQSMINEFDMDDDGCITREEFVAICLS